MNKISELSIILLAGESSGDLYGGLLAKSILKLSPQARLSGVGGEAMRKAGVSLDCTISELSIMGVSEVLLHIPRLLLLRKRLVDHIFDSGASLLILIDFPDFNLSVAKKIFQRKKRLGLTSPRIYYFVPPQVWLWRKRRISKIRQLCDGVFPLFSFEHDLYTQHGIKSFYAGHPINDIVLRDQYCQNISENQASNTTAGLFPGSRLQEIANILPIMLNAILEFDKTWNTNRKSISVLISRCGWIAEDIYSDIIHRTGMPARFSISLIPHSYEIMERSDVILAKSGTVNLEIALFGKPFIVIYKTSLLTWLIAKFLLRIHHISLINILSAKVIVKEFVQYQANPSSIAVEMNGILTDSEYRANMIKQLTEFSDVHTRRRPDSVTDEIAQFILNDIK
ncbi:lipid-A-disaccharide synthase [bacterium]|nr:MAG: lipid-A-disaccharide synthase [bacterium]